MELLRFFTAGSVDDGKSTLIGRLLYDSNSVSTDIIEALTRQSKIRGSDTHIDLALLTDGLRAEREQGITIDVAYKYFTTEKRRFIIADTPGHIQYTRNMFTGASNADVAIILLDARNGISEQTRRHSILSAILGINHVLVCINKMDLVNYSEERYKLIETEYIDFAERIGLKNVSFIPVSALAGDNVVTYSDKMNWYEGPSLLDILETIEISKSEHTKPSRFQIQYIIRPQAEGFYDYRGLAGKVLSGTYKKGQRVTVLPSGIETEIEKIEINQQEVEEASKDASVILHLKDDADASRGNSIVPSDELPSTEQEFIATICWMDNVPLINGQSLLLQHNSNVTKAVIKQVLGKIDIHSYEEKITEEAIKLNDICRVLIKAASPISFDSYSQNKSSGGFILINENTNNTVGAGTIN